MKGLLLVKKEVTSRKGSYCLFRKAVTAQKGSEWSFGKAVTARKGSCFLLVALLAAACSSQPHAYAGQVQSRSELVGGPRAVGEVGDWRLSNGRVRFIVQDKGPSRVYTTFGGSLIDADLERPNELDPYGRRVGHDGLGELFPAYFLSAIEPAKIEVLDDGSTGGTARIRVTGTQSEFLTATKFIDGATIGPGVSYAVDYALGPQDDFLTITSSVINEKPSAHVFQTNSLPIPMGFICLFGDGQPVFVPGEAGFDVRFTLEKTYQRTYKTPAFPGVTSGVVALEGDGISYGLSYCPDCESPFDNAMPPQPGFVWHHKDQYQPWAAVSPQSMLLPFVSGTLFGLFLGEAPLSLPGGEAFSTTLRLRVSDGPASHVIDEVLTVQGGPLARFSGVVREEASEEPLADADVVVFDGDTTASSNSPIGGDAVTTAHSDAQGRFTALVPPGDYVAVGRKIPRPNAQPLRFTAIAGQIAYIEPHVGRSALLAVEVSDETGRRVPAKATVVGNFDPIYKGQDPKTFLYDYRLGDPYRPTSLDPTSTEYVEATLRAGADGRAQGELRPGTYTVVTSRGPAYSIDSQQVTLAAGQLTRIGAKLTRVLPAGGRISADLHVHASGSVDSDVLLQDRALSYSAEGIDFMAMTEHNFVQDLQPVIDTLGLTDFVRSTVGIELTSLEAGHWNAYPLRYDAGEVTHGSFPWFRRTPQALFDDLRAHGKYGPDQVIVQVNHPRDTIQGYFTSYGLTGDALSGNLTADAPGKTGLFSPSGPGFGAGTFSLDFDAVEVLTGKRFDLLRTFRVPDPPPPPPHPPACTGSKDDPLDCMGAPGTVVRDSTGAVAYPGALEDWEHLLDQGHRITAVANSDSHKVLDGEGGYPRNYIDLGHTVASARDIDEREVVQAIKAGRVTASTGPDVTLRASDGTSDLPDGTLAKPDAQGRVQLHVVVNAAPWIDVTHVELMIPAPPSCFRGDPCSRMTLPLEPGAAPGAVKRLDRIVPLPVPAGRDSWVAVQVTGDKPLWPVVIPYEIPVLLLSDAVGTIGATVGLTDEFGNLKPNLIRPTTPWAVSNPVFIDGDGDGQWGVQAQRGPVDSAPLDGSGDSAQLIDLRKAKWDVRSLR